MKAGVVVTALSVVVAVVALALQLSRSGSNRPPSWQDELRSRLKGVVSEVDVGEDEEARLAEDQYKRIVVRSGGALRIPNTAETRAIDVGELELHQGARIVATGSAGAPGGDGRSGANGRTCRRGTAGTRGERGFDGANGVALDLQVLELVMHNGPGSAEAIQGGFLAVDTSGGAGGPGGRGGNGGSGGGGDRSDRCDGGSGGSGGDGGDGGDGGNGGDFRFSAHLVKNSSDEQLAFDDLGDWIQLNPSGGDAGSGGAGGSGGSGGPGRGANIFGVSANAGSRGNQGETGRRGRPGQAGQLLPSYATTPSEG